MKKYAHFPRDIYSDEMGSLDDKNVGMQQRGKHARADHCRAISIFLLR